MEAGVVAPRVFVIYSPPLRDLAPFLLLPGFFSSSSPFFFLPPPPPNVLIVPTVSSDSGKRGGE